LRRVGFVVDDNQPFSAKSAQCYAVYNDKFIVVAFRGTQVYKQRETRNVAELTRQVIDDVYADIKFKLVQSERGGSVHEGFKLALDAIWSQQLLPYLNELKPQKPGRTIWFTGHSLGAALATIAGDRYGHVKGLYTLARLSSAIATLPTIFS
jgi:triacylglycerol lipase